MSRLFQRFLAVLFLVALAACSGGGCSGCGIGDMEPLPDGFPNDSIIENVAAIRLTEPGLRFLEQNVGTLAGDLLGDSLGGSGEGGILKIEIPKTEDCLFKVFGACATSYAICSGGPKPDGSPPECTLEVDIGNADFNLGTQEPNKLRVIAKLPIMIRKLPLEIKPVGIPIKTDIVASGGGSNQCGQNGPDDFSWAQVPLNVTVTIDTDMSPAHGIRYGYSKADVKIDLDQNEIMKSVHFCPDNLGTDILNGIKSVIGGLLSNSLIGGLMGPLTDSLDSALCVQADSSVDPPACPKGSKDVKGVCRFGDKEGDPCVSTLLGMDGHMNLGGLLSSVSPGTSGALDLMVALGGSSPRVSNPSAKNGDLEPANGGATLRMMGGAIPSPEASCVPLSTMPLPTGIQIPTTFSQTNRPADWPADYPGPHAGIALSERFVAYALASAYNSGALCLGITTDSVKEVNSGLFSLLVPSLGTLTQKKPQQLALAIRPQKPPTVTFGNGSNLKTDPNIRLELPQLAIDFYVWSMDRFIRAFTATVDVDVPLNLDITTEGLVPVLETLDIKNAKVTNADLLSEDPDALAKSLASIVGSFAGQLTGGLGKPIDISGPLEDLGLTAELPPTEEGKGSPAITKIEQNGESFLGIWLALGVAESNSPRMIVSQTEATLTEKLIDPAGLRLKSMTDRNGPVVHVRASSSLDDGSRRIEYSYRVGKGFWTPWKQSRFLEIRDPSFVLQGKHTIEIASRVVGAPKSQGEHARIDFAIDIDAPLVEVGRVHNGVVELDVFDLVSDKDAVLVRWAFDDGAFSAWTRASEVESLEVGQARVLTIEAKDEEENVASTRQALIRGRKDPTLDDASSGCGCSIPGQGTDTKGLGLIALGTFALGIVWRRRNRRQEPTPPSTTPSTPSGRVSRRSLARRVLSATAVLAIAGSYGGCSCSGSGDTDDVIPGYSCETDPDCPKLFPGLIGAYTSAAVAPDGTIWVSGYNEADWDNIVNYGDLVVGRWDAATNKVAWKAIDGLPTDEEPGEYSPEGFRGGLTQPGDDVGLWTSLAIDENGHPRVAYFDVTNKALKFAFFDGETWNVSVVEEKAGSDFGRYAKLVLLPGGKPAIAYLALQPGSDNGHPTSKVRVAIGKSGTPMGSGDWAFEDAAVNETTPCRASLCKKGSQACDMETGLCLPTASCDPKCGSGKACVESPADKSPTCREIFDASKIDAYLEAYGLYISLAVTPNGEPGLVFYDRIRGNLMQARKEGGKWQTVLLDGQSGVAPDEVDTGDVGIGASLFIDSKGDWHISYADGNSEGLKYLLVKEGTTPGSPEIVDNGQGIGESKFDDGQHIIGDDSNIVVTAGGQVQISYQDATSGTLRWAVGTPQSGAGHSWEVSAIEQDGFAGAFSKQLTTESGTQIVNFFRKGGESVFGDVRLVSP